MEHRVDRDQYEEILAVVEKIPNLLQDENDIEKIKPPSTIIDPIPELGPVITNGIRYAICQYIAGTDNRIKYHLKACHN